MNKECGNWTRKIICYLIISHKSIILINLIKNTINVNINMITMKKISVYYTE